MQQHRALILRSNRFLGSSLVDKGLITTEDLEIANEKFMAQVQSDETIGRASVLYTLLYDLKSLDEGKLVELLVEDHKINLIDLSHLKLSSLRPYEVDLSDCKATWCMPFDQIEGVYMLATCYYLSTPVLRYWKDKLGENIIWYSTSMASMLRAIDMVQELHDNEDLVAEEEAEEEAEAQAAEALAKSKIADTLDSVSDTDNNIKDV